MISVSLDELLVYSDHERTKWREWVAVDPTRLGIPFQPAGRYPTTFDLLDHIFLVERRHLSRLQGAVPSESTGVPAGDVKALFEYGELVRADFRAYLSDLTGEQARETITVIARSGTRTLPRRRLATHLLLHETRHLAQLAYAARLAGVAPPGEHDLFYSPELRTED